MSITLSNLFNRFAQSAGLGLCRPSDDRRNPNEQENKQENKQTKKQTNKQTNKQTHKQQNDNTTTQEKRRKKRRNKQGTNDPRIIEKWSPK
jgi:stringent starvation protein B